MDDDTRKQVLIAWQKRKQEEIIHPFLEERAPFGLIPRLQATLLAQFLRGDRHQRQSDGNTDDEMK
jgi:CRISPR-associated protein Cas1